MFLTTHDMTDMARLCQRMLLIDHGRLLYDGAVAAVRNLTIEEPEIDTIVRRIYEDGL